VEKRKVKTCQKKTFNRRGSANEWLLAQQFRRNGADTKKHGWAQVDASAQTAST